MEQEWKEIEEAFDAICTALPEEALEAFFRDHQKVLQAAYMGRKMPKFNELKEEDFRMAFQRQRKHVAVRTYLQRLVGTWKQQYEGARDKAIDDGCTKQLAIVRGILSSPLRSCPDILFTMDMEEVRGKAAQKAILASVQELARPTASEVAEKTLKAWKKEIEKKEQKLHAAEDEQKKRLKDEEQMFHDEMKKQREAHENEKRAQEDEKKVVAQEIVKSKRELAAIQEETRAWKDAKTPVVDEPPALSDAYEASGGGILSIMAKDPSFWEGNVLRRIADVDWQSGEVTLFYRDGMEQSFEYSATILSKLLLQPDYCTLVNWHAVPNRMAPERAYYLSIEKKELRYIEVVLVPECRRLEDVVQKLKDGIRLQDSNCRWALTYPSLEEKQEALLLEKEDFSIEDGVWKLSPDCASAPVFFIERSHFLLFSDGTRRMYQQLSLGTSVRRMQLKPPMEIIRTFLIDAASRKKFAALGIKKKEWQQLRDALQGVPEKGLYARIAKACEWPETEAKKAVAAFLEAADAHMLCQDADSKVLCGIALRDDAVVAQCKSSLTEEWQEEYKKEHDLAEKELQDLRTQTETLRKKAEECRKERDAITVDVQRMKAELEQKEGLVQNVEQHVKSELERIRTHAAEEVGRLMVVAPMLAAPTVRAETPSAGSVPAEFIEQDVILHPLDEGAEDAQGLLSIVQENLDDAGLSDERISEAFAALSYACVVREFPMFLAGAASVSIADALACAFYGELPLFVDLPRTYSASVVQELEERRGRSIILQNVFATEWISHIDRLTDIGGKQLFFVAPFADDLSLLPRGISFYGVPILTDLLLGSEVPDGRSFSGFPEQELFEKSVVLGMKNRKRSPYLQSLRMMKFERSRYEDLLSLANGLSGVETPDVMEALLCGVPYAYVAGELSVYWRGLKEQTLFAGTDAQYSRRIETFFGEEVSIHA